jgi:hypothetical protein
LHTNPNGVQHLGKRDPVNVSDFRGQSHCVRTNTDGPDNFGMKPHMQNPELMDEILDFSSFPAGLTDAASRR